MMIRVACLIALLAGALLVASSAPAASKATYYVSLGDSLAQGYQPTGGPLKSGNAPPGYNQGYADQLFKLMRDRYEQLQEVKLGCGGATTTTMRFGGGFCSYTEGSQLAEAVAFLEAHPGEIAFVTVDIGGNDLVAGGVGAIVANLPVILAELEAVAGPNVPIVGMNYYDPFLPSAWEQGGLAGLQDEVARSVGFNDVLEGIYTAAGVPVADVEGAFSVMDLTLVDGTPLNVLRECEWTWACAHEPFGFDIHANSDGYGVIAQAFADVLAP
jgi:lysophospholipase L1-like esterase